jgi:hypothetical protein
MSIYVETLIRGPLEEVWSRTQDPAQHERWDLRFSHIDYLPRPDPSQAQRFRYSTRIGFGLAVKGEGEAVGARASLAGPRTSALKFWSNDSNALIREGAGYWQYVPTHDGVRFLTAYDYRVRFGRLGRAIDVLLFRPLITWATAWSFDRLRLWIERGADPAESARLALIHAVVRLGLAFAWLYQGIAPKLLEQHADELTMFADAGMTGGAAQLALFLLGLCEVAFGVSLLAARRATLHFVATVVLTTLATLAVAVASPRFLTAAFNPVSLNTLMTALAVVGLLTGRDLPSACRCRFDRSREEA